MYYFSFRGKGNAQHSPFLNDISETLFFSWHNSQQKIPASYFKRNTLMNLAQEAHFKPCKSNPGEIKSKKHSKFVFYYNNKLQPSFSAAGNISTAGTRQVAESLLVKLCQSCSCVCYS